MPNRFALITVALASTAALGLSACGDGGGDVQAFCSMSNDMEDFDPLENVDPTDAEAVRAAFGEMETALDDLAATAPDEIADDAATHQRAFAELVSVMEEVDYDLSQVDEDDVLVMDQESVVAAGDRLEDWTDTNCTTDDAT